MFSKEINRPIPVKHLLLFLLGASVIIQCAIMSYQHLTGSYPIKDTVTFFATIILSSLISTLAGFTLAIPDLYVIKGLNRKVKWGEKTFIRIFIQFILAIAIGIIISTALTLLDELIIGYNEPLVDVLIRNGLIFPVVNILLMTIHEGWMFFKENKRNKEKAEQLSHELLQIQFEVLKNQVDPHFMFNNLNVLSALIDNDPVKAQQFIEEFSDLYRYVLDTIEKPVISVAKEVNFIKSYIYLQQIRHNEAIIIENYIPEEINEAKIPPFSLQIVIENAIKHNAASKDNPLRIELSYSNKYIEVRNNIQPPISSKYSTGLGQSNLMKRYELLSDILPLFEKRSNMYIAKLPLINED